jgi:hypothetical protein
MILFQYQQRARSVLRLAALGSGEAAESNLVKLSNR